MSPVGSAACTAQVLGITASGIAAGHVISHSFTLVPTLLLPNTNSPKRTFDSTELPGAPVGHVATQFRYAYNLGASTMPFCFAIAGSAFTYAAHAFRQGATRNVAKSNLFLTAAALALAPIPYTLIVMRPTNKRLLGRAEQADAEGPVGKERAEIKESREEAVVVNWLKTWSWMNLARGFLPLGATVVGLCAAL